MPKIIDAGGLNSSSPSEILYMKSQEDITTSIRKARILNKKLSIFGTKHSQAGQICQDRSIALDMNLYNKVVRLDLEKKQITVESGIQWKEIQEVIHPHGLAIQIMQFVNTFTVGGSLSANIFSRDPRVSRLIETVISFTLILANEEVVFCSRELNRELFSLAIEGHGLFGVIGEVTFQLIDNTSLRSESFLCSCEHYMDNTIHPKLAYQSAEYIDKNTLFATNYYETTQNCKLTRHQVMTMSRETDLTFWNPKGSDALLGFFIPLTNFRPFQKNLFKIIKNSKLSIIKCSLNYLPGNQESFLSPPFRACVKMAVFYRQSKSNAPLTNNFKEACTDALIQAQGSPYLTFDFYATAPQMDLFYPSWRAFLKKKLEYDPQEIFYNQFYDKLKNL